MDGYLILPRTVLVFIYFHLDKANNISKQRADFLKDRQTVHNSEQRKRSQNEHIQRLQHNSNRLL